ncbi:MAG: hypothetical protein LBE54_05570 [Brucellaceae bacterium]|nr:hypothetical protein [Brucellaceae bacterium]
MPTKNDAISSRLDDLIKMRTLLHPREWKNESALMMNRWFDYRFTSPLSLTLQFGKIYQEKLRAHLRRHEDVAKSNTVYGTKTYTPAEPAAWFTALWKARQRADEFFLPYEAYIEFSFDFSSRRKRYWTMLPSQLHPSAKNKEAWLECFDEFYNDRAPALIRGAGAIAQYRLENDLSLPAQNQFREVMLSVLENSPRLMSEKIAERVHAKRHIDLESALTLVKKDDRENVEKDALSSFNDGFWPAEPKQKLDAVNLLPSCFGVFETINAKASPCSKCPVAKQCQTFGQKAMKETERLTGFSSPAWESEKKRNRMNTANHRKRKEDALSGAGDILSEVP